MPHMSDAVWIAIFIVIGFLAVYQKLDKIAETLKDIKADVGEIRDARDFKQ
jgi:hypothetical protein